jgi:HlyD family secretion protein
MQKLSLTMPKLPWSIVAIASLLIVTGAFYMTRTRLSANENTSEMVTPAAPTAVTAVGRIEPQGSIIKLSVTKSQDSRVNQILVKEGEQVKAGQIIAILQGLDKEQAAIAKAEQNVALQQARLQQSQTATATDGTFQAQVFTVKQLQAELATETASGQATVEQQQVKVQKAQQDYNRFEQLALDGAISEAELDGYRETLKLAQAEVKTAQADLDNIRSSLSAQIESAQAKLMALDEVRPVAVAVAHAQVSQAVAELEVAQAALEDFYVRVPVAGQILSINTQVGEQVNAQEGIVDLAQTEQMYVIAEVYETDIPRVKQGQRATVVSESGGLNATLQGTVEHIGLQIKKTDVLQSDPAADENARIVEVKIRLDPADSEKVKALTYMQVRVKILSGAL